MAGFARLNSLSTRPSISVVPDAPAVGPELRRLFADYREVESAYARKTGIFPIMHVIALRREIYEHDRWLAMNLFGMHAY